MEGAIFRVFKKIFKIILFSLFSRLSARKFFVENTHFWSENAYKFSIFDKNFDEIFELTQKPAPQAKI